MNDMSETPIPATTEELRKTRQLAAYKALLAFTMTSDMRAPHDFDTMADRVRADLTENERLELLDILIRSFPADIAEAAVKANFEGQGWPEPTLMDDPRADAQFWASGANAREIGAYAVACFNVMSPKRRTDFCKWVSEKVQGK